MSASYKAISWTRSKIIYDGILLLGITGYLALYLVAGPRISPAADALDLPILQMHAFGTCAFLLLSFILAIGPLARLDKRFLMVLYNRRHLGVATAAVACCHAYYVLGWYFAFSPTPPLIALFGANPSIGLVYGFPFELFGIAALAILVVMAATSHDFWLSFLTPKVWKALHMLVYLAYGLIVLHVTLGALLSRTTPILALMVMASVVSVSVLHLMAAAQEQHFDASQLDRLRNPASTFLFVGTCADFKPERALVVAPPQGDRIAVFLHKGQVSAISNVCAHQNGPLGEGRIVDGLVTCPWHGFQYRLADGCAPPPFHEKVRTYQVHLLGGAIYVDPAPLPLGASPRPVTWPEIMHLEAV